MDPEQAEAAPATPAAAADPKLYDFVLGAAVTLCRCPLPSPRATLCLCCRKGVKGWSTKTLTRTLRLLNACNACGVVVAGVITGLLAFVDSDATFSEITTCAYMAYASSCRGARVGLLDPCVYVCSMHAAFWASCSAAPSLASPMSRCVPVPLPCCIRDPV